MNVLDYIVSCCNLPWVSILRTISGAIPRVQQCPQPGGLHTSESQGKGAEEKTKQVVFKIGDFLPRDCHLKI